MCVYLSHNSRLISGRFYGIFINATYAKICTPQKCLNLQDLDRFYTCSAELSGVTIRHNEPRHIMNTRVVTARFSVRTIFISKKYRILCLCLYLLDWNGLVPNTVGRIGSSGGLILIWYKTILCSERGVHLWYLGKWGHWKRKIFFLFL